MGGEAEAAAPKVRGGDIGLLLLADVAVAGGIGYLLDRWMGWSPWGLLTGCFLGFGAWLRMMWKVMRAA